jgi:hypothetical protein
MNQWIKNFIGDFLGYSRCQFSGMTFYREEIVSVRYTPTRGHIFVKRGINCLSDKQVIAFAKQCISLTLADQEELQQHPEFHMTVERSRWRRLLSRKVNT